MRTKYDVGNGFVKVKYEFFEVLSPKAGLLLSYIIDTYANPKLRFKDGYARYTNAYIQSMIPFSDYEIRTLLQEIESEGFIQIKVEKSKNAVQRWLRLDYHALDDFLQNDEFDEYNE